MVILSIYIQINFVTSNNQKFEPWFLCERNQKTNNILHVSFFFLQFEVRIIKLKRFLLKSMNYDTKAKWIFHARIILRNVWCRYPQYFPSDHYLTEIPTNNKWVLLARCSAKGAISLSPATKCTQSSKFHLNSADFFMVEIFGFFFQFRQK